MSDFSDILPHVPEVVEDQKKPGWARLRGKILSHATHVGRPRSHTDSLKPPQDDEINAFLGLPSAPQPPPGPLRRRSAPTIDVSAASRWHNVVALASRAEQEQAWEDRQQRVKYSKPPRRIGLKVEFVTTGPEVIGEGGDEAELPAQECGRGKSMVLPQQHHHAPSQVESQTREAYRREGLHGAQKNPDPRPTASALQSRPLPATPGPTMEARMAIVTDAIANMSTSDDHGYFPQLPSPPLGTGSFQALNHLHPALRTGTKPMPANHVRSISGNSPTLPPPPATQASHQQIPQLPQPQARRHSPPFQLPDVERLLDHAERQQPESRHTRQDSSPIRNVPRSTNAHPIASTPPPQPRRGIPAELALSFGPSVASPPPPHPSNSTSGASDANRASPTRRPFPPHQANSLGSYPSHFQHSMPGLSLTSERPPSRRLQSEPTSLSVEEEGHKRNVSQPYPIMTKGFVGIRRAVAGGRPSRPGSSSNARRESSQDEPSHPVGLARPSSSSSSYPRDVRQSPTRPPFQRSAQDPTHYALPPTVSQPQQPSPSRNTHESPKDATSANAALFTFTSCTPHLTALIRHATTTTMPFPPAKIATVTWLRLAVQWFLCAGTGFERLAQRLPKGLVGEEEMMTYHIDLCKVWYIITDIVEPRLRQATAPHQQAQQQAPSSSAELKDLFLLTDGLVESIKGVCLFMAGRGMMPEPLAGDGSHFDIDRGDVVIWVDDERVPRGVGELIGFLRERMSWVR